MSDILEGTGNVPPQAFVKWNDPIGNPLVSINRDGTITTQGITFSNGTEQTTAVNTAVIPTVQASLQAINTTIAHTISISAPLTTLYTVSLYVSAPGTGAAGHTLVVTINYTCELGPEIITVVVPLDAAGITMETYPLLVLGGTSVTLSTAYGGGATNDPYNISTRIVQMP